VNHKSGVKDGHVHVYSFSNTTISVSEGVRTTQHTILNTYMVT
jgi:hypothetical protein